MKKILYTAPIHHLKQITLFIFIAISTTLFAEKRVELITLYPIPSQECEAIAQSLAQREHPVTVAASDGNKLCAKLKRKKSRLQKLLAPLRVEAHRKAPLNPDIEKIIFVNADKKQTRKWALERLPKEKLILFMWEPKFHLQDMYSQEFHKHFSRIYTWDDDIVDNKRYFKFYYPVLKPMLHELPSFEEKKLLTLVSGYSRKYFEDETRQKKHPEELYSERKRAIQYFQEHEQEFTFYGRGWDSNTYPRYGGPIADKIETIKHYKFSICYENCKEVRGYITEKIFDCFQAGNVPIYWGASNITDYIPPECFIDRRAFSSYQELHHYLKTMTKEKYDTYLAHIKNFLESKTAKPFSVENYHKTLYEAITAP